MTSSIIIIVCLLLLLAYVFDISSALTKIPSVILLLLLGWMMQQIANVLTIAVPDLSTLLPVFGTIGLILIVLDGALELELDNSKISIIKKSFWVAMIPMLAFAFLFAWAFQIFSGASYNTCLINAIPFCVISSAIAIPSVRNLSSDDKEFIVYESSLSDILGVLFFNFMALNEYISPQSFLHFGLQVIFICLISFAAVLGLSLLLSRISHHITYTPIILLVILIYVVSKELHLPSLIFILVFGLFLGNLERIKSVEWTAMFWPEKLDKEVAKFKAITIEATFLIRSLFFLLFGFLMDAKEIASLNTLPWALAIASSTIFIRWAVLKVFHVPPTLLWVSPRGLITVLLFLAIFPQQRIPFVNNALVLQTIILSVFAMMFGLMAVKRKNVLTSK